MQQNVNLTSSKLISRGKNETKQQNSKRKYLKKYYQNTETHFKID